MLEFGIYFEIFCYNFGFQSFSQIYIQIKFFNVVFYFRKGVAELHI